MTTTMNAFRYPSTILSAILLTVAIAGEANANSVFNRYETRHEHGRSSLQIDSSRLETGTIYQREQSIKGLADKGDFNRVNIKFDGENFTGNASSSNGRPVDPIAKFSYVDTQTTTKFVESTITDFDENLKFDSYQYTHETGNR